MTEVVSPAWAARLELGTVTARLNTATISFWGKAQRPCSLFANLLDADARYAWLAFWQPLNLTAEWSFLSVKAPLGEGLAGHTLQSSLVLGGCATTYHVDGVTLRQSCESWPTPWQGLPAAARLVTGFEDCTGAMPRAVELRIGASGASGASGGGGAVDVELYSESAARTGRFGARLTAAHAGADAKAPIANAQAGGDGDGGCGARLGRDPPLCFWDDACSHPTGARRTATPRPWRAPWG